MSLFGDAVDYGVGAATDIGEAFDLGDAVDYGSQAFTGLDFSYELGDDLITQGIGEAATNPSFWDQSLDVITKGLSNPAVLKGIGYGALGATQYMANKDNIKAQKQRQQADHQAAKERQASQQQHDMAFLDKKNDMENERHFIKPSGFSGNQGLLAQYGSLPNRNNAYQQKLTLDDEEKKV